MDIKNIKRATENWKEMTHKALDFKSIPSTDMENLIKETYMILTEYHKETLVPKEITRMLLELQIFLELSSAMELTEDRNCMYNSFDITVIASALTNGFLDGEYECDFPKLKLYDLEKKGHIIDLRDKFLPLTFDSDN